MYTNGFEKKEMQIKITMKLHPVSIKNYIYFFILFIQISELYIKFAFVMWTFSLLVDSND